MFLFPPGCETSPSQSYPSIKFASTHPFIHLAVSYPRTPTLDRAQTHNIQAITQHTSHCSPSDSLHTLQVCHFGEIVSIYDVTLQWNHDFFNPKLFKPLDYFKSNFCSFSKIVKINLTLIFHISFCSPRWFLKSGFFNSHLLLV